MRKLACSILTLTILACSLCLVSNVHASTAVSGIITTDTIWTTANSPIQLTGPLCVFEGATLTIEPGVTVDLGTYYLQVNGTLKAQGTSSNRIIFTSDKTTDSDYGTKRIAFTPVSIDWDEQTQSGSIIEYVTSFAVEIFVLDSSPKICNNIFPNAVTAINIGSGSPYVCNNEITAGDIDSLSGNTVWPCLAAHGSPTVINNTITGNGHQFGMTATHTAYVANNKISNCWSGIKATDSATIIGNVIVNNTDVGILSESNTVTIQNNYISNNQNCGIVGGGIIQRNTIANSLIGIKDPLPEITLQNNNILNNSQNSIYLSTSNNLEAANNYWGTTNIQSINQTIRDFKNDFKLGVVNFVPILNEAVDIGTSDVEPTATPTPTPTTTQTTTTQPYSTPDPENFNIESNSTVTAFTFDSNTQQISFTVNGPENTTGYVKITIAKTCMPNSDFEVYLDGNHINYNLEATTNTWIITFTYHHSSHQVTINSPVDQPTTSTELPDWMWNAVTAIVAIMVIVAVSIFAWLTRHKSTEKQP
jgi:uncharacterized protein YxeA